MTDVHSKATRSFNMSRIRSKNTKPELIVRSFLFANGFRYRVHDFHLPGKPDIVLPKHKTLIFINGCFWHGHRNCRYYKIPRTRTKWWIDKIDKNVANDSAKKMRLKADGWKILTIWECKLKPTKREKTLLSLLNYLLK